MPLTDEQRAELEALGPETVRAKLIQAGAGRGASLAGFKTGFQGDRLTRGDIEDWLAEKNVQETAERKRTLWWAMVAGWGVIATVIIGIVTIGVMFWLAK
jgi:hypothetical protein